jgi:SAM-dependent methyltransferase
VAYALERFDLEVEGAVVLHVAANVGERRFIEDLRPRVHVRADLTMTSAFNLVTDVTDLAVASASVDLAFAWHVLEHIPDDRAAIAEVTRVIRPGGAFLMSVPIHPRENPVTIDDPSLSPAAPEATFGHPDHVRNCGLDYGGRLTDAGLAVAFVAVADVDDSATDGLGLSRNHVVWCGRRPGSVREPAVGAIPT